MEHKPPVAKPISRGALIGGALSLGFASTINIAKAANLKPILIAEPVHSVGYLPLYIAIDQGFFAKRGLDVKTLNASGGAHVTALVMMAKKGMAPKSSSNAELAALMKGKKIALSRYGGTPDVCGRWLLKKVGLDPKNDVQIVNQSDSAAAPFMVKSGAVDIAIASEPQITYGKQQGIWDDPFFSFPSLGEYSYSVISVRKSTMTNDPQTTQAFTDAMLEGLRLTQSSRATAESVAHKEFATLSDAGIKGALDRFYNDHIWSKDGLISARGFALDMDVVYTTGEFNTPVAYSSVIDMEYVIKSKVGKA
jgi:NitT/TauT family transport system substrate-binding protein